MIRKTLLAACFLLASCGDSDPSGDALGDLPSYDQAALEKLVEDGKLSRAVKIIRAREQLRIAQVYDFEILAEIYIKDLNGVAAEVAVDKARKAGALRNATALKMATAFMLQGKSQEAKEELQSVPITSEGGFESLMMQGEIAIQEGSPELGRRYYHFAGEMKPENFRVDAALAFLELGQTNLDAADANARAAAVKNGDSPIPDYILGVTARIRGQKDESIAHLEKSIQLQEDYIHSQIEVIGAYLDVKRIEDAEKMLDKVALAAPDYPLTQFYIAYLEAEKGNLVKAEETLLRVGDLLRSYPAATRLYGIVSYKLKKYDAAADYLKLYLQTRPDDRIVRLALVESLNRAGFPGPALAVLEPLLDETNDDVAAQTQAGAVNAALGRLDAAKENYARAVVLASKEKSEGGPVINGAAVAELIYGQAVTAFSAGNKDEAIRLLLGITGGETAAVPHLNVLANMQLDNGNLDDAIATATKIRQQDAESTVAYNIEGAAYYRGGKMPEAIAAFSKAITAKPDYQSALKNRAAAFVSQKQLAEARLDLEKLAALNTTDPQVYGMLGNICLTLDDFSAAIRAYSKVRKLMPQSAVFAANYAHALGEAGYYDDALREAAVALQLAPRDTAISGYLKPLIEKYEAETKKKVR